MLKTDQVIRLASMESHDSDDEEMLRMYEGLPSDVWGRE